MLEEGNTSKPTRIEQIVIDEASPHEVKGINTLVWFGLVWLVLVWFGLVWFGLLGGVHMGCASRASRDELCHKNFPTIKIVRMNFISALRVTSQASYSPEYITPTQKRTLYCYWNQTKLIDHLRNRLNFDLNKNFITA